MQIDRNDDGISAHQTIGNDNVTVGLKQLTPTEVVITITQPLSQLNLNYRFNQNDGHFQPSHKPLRSKLHIDLLRRSKPHGEYNSMYNAELKNGVITEETYKDSSGIQDIKTVHRGKQTFFTSGSNASKNLLLLLMGMTLVPFVAGSVSVIKLLDNTIKEMYEAANKTFNQFAVEALVFLLMRGAQYVIKVDVEKHLKTLQALEQINQKNHKTGLLNKGTTLHGSLAKHAKLLQQFTKALGDDTGPITKDALADINKGMQAALATNAHQYVSKEELLREEIKDTIGVLSVPRKARQDLVTGLKLWFQGKQDKSAGE